MYWLLAHPGHLASSPKILGEYGCTLLAFNEERVLSELGYEVAANIGLKVKIDGKLASGFGQGVCVAKQSAARAADYKCAAGSWKSAHAEKLVHTRKAFFSYCIERGYISGNPLQGEVYCRRQAVEDSIAPMVQRDTVRRILDGVNGESLRSRIWCGCLRKQAYAGRLRALCDVDRQARTIHVEAQSSQAR